MYWWAKARGSHSYLYMMVQQKISFGGEGNESVYENKLMTEDNSLLLKSSTKE